MNQEHTASMEDYLESVAILRSRGKAVRVKDISASLGVKMPSVTAALKRLSDDGLVFHEKYGRVKLTAAGEKAAKNVFRRHEILRRFLVGVLDIDPDTAREDACRMEHTISPTSLERLSKFLGFVESCPADELPWLGYYRDYLEHGEIRLQKLGEKTR